MSRTRATLTYDSNQAFVLKLEDLEDVRSLLEDVGEGVEITFAVTFAGKMEVRFPTIRRLANYVNSRREEILSITAKAKSDDTDAPLVIVIFEAPRPTRTRISMFAEGPVDKIGNLKRSLDIYLLTLKPGYAALARLPIFRSVLAVSGVMTIVLLTLGLTATPPDDVLLTVLYSFAAIGGVSLFVFVGYCLMRLQRRVFPRGLFAIGRSGVGQSQSMRHVHWGVLVALFISIAAGLIVASVIAFVQVAFHSLK